MFDSRTNLSKDVGNELKKFFEDKVFKSVIPRNIRLSEAPSRGLSIYEYAPSSAGAIAYERLANEIIGRFGGGFGTMIRPNLSKMTWSK